LHESALSSVFIFSEHKCICISLQLCPPQDTVLLKHAAVSSQQQPMTASTISSLEHSAEYIVRPVSGQANPPRLSFPFFL